MCTNDENPHLIDTHACLLHVEYHVIGLVTDLVVRQGNTLVSPNVVAIKTCRSYHWNTQKGPVATVKEKQEEIGVVGLPKEFCRTIPSRTSEDALLEWENVDVTIDLLSSERKLIF